MTPDAFRSSPVESRKSAVDGSGFLILSGLVTAIALGQIAGSGGDAVPSGVLGFGLAVLTVFSLGRRKPVRIIVEYTFAGFAVAALIPAMLRLTGSGCPDGLNQRAQTAALIVFTLAFLVVAAFTIVIRQNWVDLRYVGPAWIGFIEAALFWSEPAAWSTIGTEHASLSIAIAASVLCGFVVGLAPAVGLGLVGAVLALGTLATLFSSTSTCFPSDATAAVTVMGVFLVTLFFLNLLRGRIAK